MLEQEQVIGSPSNGSADPSEDDTFSKDDCCLDSCEKITSVVISVASILTAIAVTAATASPLGLFFLLPFIVCCLPPIRPGLDGSAGVWGGYT